MKTNPILSVAILLLGLLPALGHAGHSKMRGKDFLAVSGFIGVFAMPYVDGIYSAIEANNDHQGAAALGLAALTVAPLAGYKAGGNTYSVLAQIALPLGALGFHAYSYIQAGSSGDEARRSRALVGFGLDATYLLSFAALGIGNKGESWSALPTGDGRGMVMVFRHRFS